MAKGSLSALCVFEDTGMAGLQDVSTGAVTAAGGRAAGGMGMAVTGQQQQGCGGLQQNAKKFGRGCRKVTPTLEAGGRFRWGVRSRRPGGSTHTRGMQYFFVPL